jgi:hypothetical protein
VDGARVRWFGVALVFSISACGAGAEEAADDVEALHGNDNVRLLSATLGGGDCSFCTTLGARIAVRNLAYDKEVELTWSVVGQSGTAPARYLSSAGNGWEIWWVPLWAPAYLPSPLVQGDQVSLGVRYRVNGASYEDNGYQMVLDSDGTARAALVGRDRNVAVAWETGSAGRGGYSYAVVIAVRNLAYAKRVELVYSTDQWASVQVAQATWMSGPADNGAELWLVYGPQMSSFDYAVSYTVEGRTYWDNNFGANFHVTR